MVLFTFAPMLAASPVSGSSAPTVTFVGCAVPVRTFDVHPAVKTVPSTTSATTAVPQRLVNGIRVSALNEVR
jgi:hypothetical protein